MNEIYNEIDQDVNKDKLFNLIKKYKLILFILISLTLITLTYVIGKNIIFESRAKKNTQEYVEILNLLSDKKNEEAKKRLELLKDSKINIYKVLSFTKLLELSKNNKSDQILILDQAIKSNINKLDKDLFKIKKSLLIFDVSDENQILILLNPNNFKDSPWRPLSLEILGDFYLSKGQKIKAKEMYEQALKIPNIPIIFKNDIEKKYKNIR
jgi:predicted negative regulator of RcsB-dependent stress response